jgi:hypothetical protein
MLNKYATQKAACTTADLTLKPPTLKYHKCTAPGIGQECAKDYTTYFHIKILSDNSSSHMKS